MPDKEKASKKLSPEKMSKIEKEKLEEAKRISNYEQPPSDSEFDICGPLDCDKQL